MSRENRLRISKAKDSIGKSQAMKILSSDDYLTGEMAHLRMDIDKRIHKAGKDLANSTTTEEGKSVSFKMLATEALLDLFEKYNRGEGTYKFDDWWRWEPKK